jgi:hypothetical protein
MKTFRKAAILVLCMWLLIGLTSCAVFVTRNDGKRVSDTRDNGKHKGWFKNPNNPHNPHTTNPGQKKDKPNNNFPQH